MSRAQFGLVIDSVGTLQREGEPFPLTVRMVDSLGNPVQFTVQCGLYLISPGLSTPQRKLLYPSTLNIVNGVGKTQISVYCAADSVSIFADAGGVWKDTSNDFKVLSGDFKGPRVAVQDADRGNIDSEEGYNEFEPKAMSFKAKAEETPSIFAYPNPMSDSTTIVFDLPEGISKDASIRIFIYDAFGHRVWDDESSVSELLVWDDGRYCTGWNGQRDDGLKVANGIYNLIIINKGGGSRSAALKTSIGVMR
ncbi:hypothetical protein CH333_06405 [candidate division WOR-3 bacterium JGI_Cruoil_03_44_89]|uniref:FlgD Ig-like domain-containing protein n=1 Tax=candidate division WOR-3 bacterium JGI_Cruoil_03_44_89 TaxID=1973748 RepID=A0A235BT06_UNCW3|nr:MAG: hypothetical protein CH333_06405 [candidate division WOR-3 bacterium JGI_Cruoil_03_44_89]